MIGADGVLNLFSGADGWGEGARAAGYTGPMLGVEVDPVPAAVAQAAGHSTIVGDVAALDPHDVAPHGITGLIASPPCQSFSQAGKRGGETDPRGALVREPLRWALALDPQWIACEQVPQVLPIWQDIGAALAAAGYSVWAGLLDSADYGVPQHRKRAILIARRHGAASPPMPLPGWPPTMADALGWGMTARPYFTLAAARTSGGPDKEKVGGSGARKALYAERAAGRWIDPATPEADGAIRVRLDEAATLQGFRPSYPWQGTMTQQYRQVSNAVPPPLATAILAPLFAAAAGAGEAA